MAAKMLVRYRTKKLKSPEEIQDFSFGSQNGLLKLSLSPVYLATPILIPVSLITNRRNVFPFYYF